MILLAVFCIDKYSLTSNSSFVSSNIINICDDLSTGVLYPKISKKYCQWILHFDYDIHIFLHILIPFNIIHK